ncbi:hypothetical protein HYT23_04190 [Candidatus Pacearchaeota archaeon]|nr:hypothetical protein [Candidatus Pacearchaeota archaeon]
MVNVDFSQIKDGLQQLSNSIKERQPSLRAVIDYCRLHQTTGREEYRMRAVDCMRSYETLMRAGNNFVSKPLEVVYTEVLKEFGVDDPAPLLGMLKIAQPEIGPVIEGLEKVVNLLREKDDLAPLNNWREHCIRCATPDGKCESNIAVLETRYQERLTALESAWDKVLEAARPYVGKFIRNTIQSGEISGLGLGKKSSKDRFTGLTSNS